MDKILMDFGNVRIIRTDDQNVEVQQLKITPEHSVTDKETGDMKIVSASEKWVLFGYYPSVNMALANIFKYDLMIPDQQMELSEYLHFQKQAIEKLENMKL